jgi:hypothetical protein
MDDTKSCIQLRGGYLVEGGFKLVERVDTVAEHYTDNHLMELDHIVNGLVRISSNLKDSVE